MSANTHAVLYSFRNRKHPDDVHLLGDMQHLECVVSDARAEGISVAKYGRVMRQFHTALQARKVMIFAIKRLPILFRAEVYRKLPDTLVADTEGNLRLGGSLTFIPKRLAGDSVVAATFNVLIDSLHQERAILFGMLLML